MVVFMSKDLRKQKGNKTKELIILSVLEILFKEGQTALTTRRLAEKAGVSKGNIYHHFKNMDMILEEAFKFSVEESYSKILKIKYNNLSELIENIVLNTIDIIENQSKSKYTSSNTTGHDIFLEVVSSNKKLLSFLETVNLRMRKWIAESINKQINKKISDELETYVLDIIMIFLSGMRTDLFLMNKNIDSYKKSWKILSKHLVERILEEMNE